MRKQAQNQAKEALNQTLYAIRIGDADDYQAFFSPFMAGYTVGMVLERLGYNHRTVEETLRRYGKRVEVGEFVGDNYISVFKYVPNLKEYLNFDYCELDNYELFEKSSDGFEDYQELDEDEWQEFLEGLSQGMLPF